MLSSTSASTYTVVARDDEAIPTPVPAGTATFTPATSISVTGGEVLALTSTASGGAACYISGLSVPTADSVALGAATVPTVGSSLSALSFSPPNYTMNVSAVLAQSTNVSLTAAATPATITAGGAASLGYLVTNGGPSTGPITFTTTVPAGLSLVGAVAGSGTCTTAGQAVTCTINGLAVGTTAPVSVIVTAPTAGTYATTGTVSTALTEASPADNGATATLTVAPAPTPAPAPASPPACKTVALKGVSLAFAKKVLVALNCKVGTVTKKTSKTVKKGLVLSTSPGAGKTLANGTAVKIVESSGPPKKKAKAKKKKKG